MSQFKVLGIKKLVSFSAKYHDLVPATADAHLRVANFEKAAGCALPADLMQFYHECETVEIGAVEILSSDKIRAVRTIYGDSMQAQFSSSWFAFASLHDSTFIAFDTLRNEGAILYINPYADMGQQLVIADSFGHFLSNLLLADGEPFWLDSSYEYEPLGVIYAPDAS